nr:hypothetical protein [Ralstonia solanacearum]
MRDRNGRTTTLAYNCQRRPNSDPPFGVSPK